MNVSTFGFAGGERQNIWHSHVLRFGLEGFDEQQRQWQEEKDEKRQQNVTVSCHIRFCELVLFVFPHFILNLIPPISRGVGIVKCQIEMKTFR